MNYIDIYNNIENPLDNDELLDILANAYKNRRGSFYHNLVRNTKKKYSQKYMPAEADKFYANAFNKWKQGLLSLTSEELEDLKARQKFDNRIHKLIEYLKTTPNVKNEQEARQILYGQKNDKELESAIEDYSWESLGAFSGWIHVNSRYFNGKRGSQFHIDHRLYLNTEGIDTHKVVNEFIRKCDERNIPYYFKFDDTSNRDDSIVIYSNTEWLPLYIEVLQDIAKENPDIRQRCQNPPILTGKIDGWIGYGSEPTPKNGKNRSFNEVRGKCLEKAIEIEMDAWLKANKNRSIKYKGQNISLVDYIANLAASSEIESMQNSLFYASSTEDQQKREERLGYNKAYIENPRFKERLVNELRPRIQECLTGDSAKVKSFEFALQNGKTYYITANAIKHYPDLLAPQIMKKDPEFRKKVLESIRKVSESEDIDVTKYCFDKTAKDKLLKQDQDASLVQAYYEDAKRRLESMSKQAPREKSKYETNQQYLAYLKSYYRTNATKNAQQDSQKTASPTKVENKTVSTSSSLSNKGASEPPRGMTDEEIKASQIKLGLISPDLETSNNYTVHPTNNNPKHQTKDVVGMTDEEIKASQIKLGLISKEAPLDTTYRLKRDQIIQDLPIYSQQASRYTGAMSAQEIKVAQKRLGVHPTYNKYAA